MTYNVLKRQKSTGDVKEIGRITEWFKKPQAGVVKLKETTLSKGDSIFLVGESYCQLAMIESLMQNDKSISSIQIGLEEVEIGLKFNIDANKGLYLYKYPHK